MPPVDPYRLPEPLGAHKEGEVEAVGTAKVGRREIGAVESRTPGGGRGRRWGWGWGGAGIREGV